MSENSSMNRELILLSSDYCMKLVKFQKIVIHSFCFIKAKKMKNFNENYYKKNLAH